MNRARRHDFSSRAALADALALAVADALRAGIDLRGGATLAVSGGATPAAFLDALSSQALDWGAVIVTLVDERFAPPTSDRSNERLVRRHLLRGPAAAARFVPLHTAAPDVYAAAEAADRALARLALPFDAVVLGMGLDTHTASFFADAETLDALLDPEGKARVLPVDAPSAGEPRLTLTLPVIASARLLVLHIEGEAKRAALDAAPPSSPIRRTLDAAANPPHIYWAP